MKAKVIAFYLPQFHPCEENDEWWGKGFTEWTNVGKAKPLFKGHNQPRVPSDLGYYDLRLPEVREAQVEYAKKAGVAAFCYWHYWLGGGKRLLNYPLEEVVRSGSPDFPFMLGWANHSWYSKHWNHEVKMLENKLLVEQTYPGIEDIDNHFFAMLPMFKDSRYYKISNKLAFYIYDVRKVPDLKMFIDRWNELAELNDLPGFFFISCASGIEELSESNHSYCDAVNLTFLTEVFGGRKSLKLYIKEKIGSLFNLPLNKITYEDALSKMNHLKFAEKRIFPTIIPNWDNTARRAGGATILVNSSPSLFYRHCTEVFEQIKDKDEDFKIVFLKSWNEWAEGNYMEPDLQFGTGYIDALYQALKTK